MHTYYILIDLKWKCGVPKRSETEIGQFNRRNSEILCIFLWISEIGILVNTDIFILKDIERIY